MRFAQNCFSLRLDHFGEEDLCISYLDHPWRHLWLLQSFNSGITLLLPANRRGRSDCFKRCISAPCPLSLWSGRIHELGGQVKAWPLLFKAMALRRMMGYRKSVMVPCFLRCHLLLAGGTPC